MKSSAEKGESKFDEFNHGRMLDAIKNLTSKKQSLRWTASQRTETVPVSEFTLNGKEQVNVGNLLKSLGKTANLTEIGREVKKTKDKKHKVLKVPLEKPVATKINRVIAYDNVCKEVSKWEKVVFQNRAADQLVFPLNQPDLRMQTNAEVVKRFKLTTPLELEVQALLKQEQPIVREDVEDEDVADTRRTLEEVAEMRHEMKKLRARMTYEEAKSRYRKKIKSKRYHRILKKERMKKEVKEFEALQKTNPELAQAKLDRLDQARVLERMTLRHRNTGKWAREQILKFKDDKDSGRAIQEQIQLSRQLTAKAYVPSDSDEEGDDKDNKVKTESSSKELKLSSNDASNPWMTAGSRVSLRHASESVKEDVESKLLVGYRKLWEEENRRNQVEGQEQLNLHEENADEMKSNKKVEKTKRNKKSLQKKTTKVAKLAKPGISVTDNGSNASESEEETDNIDETLIRKRLWEDFDHFEPDTNKKQRLESTSKSRGKNKKDVVATKKEDTVAPKEEDVVVDPHDFITVKGKVIKCNIPDEAYNDDEAMDDGTDDMQTVDNRMTIAEAFADDDVIDEFIAEKQSAIDKDKPKDIDLTLPGWGEWSGKDVEVSDWKKKFVIKLPQGPPRKDRGLCNVILNEKAEESVMKFQVSDIPKQFKTAEEFEKSIAAPIGKLWNPETAFNRLIAPKVVTKLGAIIEPIDDSFLEKKNDEQTMVHPRNNKKKHK